MRSLIIVCLTALGVCTAQAGELAPYTAYIASEEALVHSGPGSNFYPTSRLKHGDAVEVYRHEANGWCAIRPPQGSFCWVPADAVTVKNGVAKLNRDHVSAAIGSTLVAPTADFVAPVELQPGEEVELLGDKKSETSWNLLRIAPPSGEFRFIQQQFLEREPPSRYRRVSATSEDQGPILQAGGPPRSEGWTPIDPSRTRGTNNMSLPGTGNPPDAVAPNLLGPAHPASSGFIAEPLQRQLDLMEVELSGIVGLEPEQWSFDSLRSRTETLYGKTQNSAEQERVRSFHAKLNQLEGLRRRHEDWNRQKADYERRMTAFRGPAPTALTTPLPGSVAVAGPIGSPSLAAPTGPALGAPPAVPLLSELSGNEPQKFDYAGRLKPVKSSRPGAPSFALVDGQQRVLSFITPAPGVNLQGLVGQDIGVSGERGYIPEFNAPHVTARQVTILR